MKTNGKLVELYDSLQSATQIGEVDNMVSVFKNIKLMEPVVYPLLESKKLIDKMLDNYRRESSALFQQFGDDFGNGLSVPPFMIKEDGKLDFSKPNPKYADFKTKMDELKATNQNDIDKYEAKLASYNLKMDSMVSDAELRKLKFTQIDQENCKIYKEINLVPWFEFGLVKI